MAVSERRRLRTAGPMVARFFERNFRHTKGPNAGQPFLLEEWQVAFLNEFYSVDKQGRRLYKTGVLGIPRGNGKTPLAAGIGLYEVVARRDSPDVFVAAGSREQARIATDFAGAFVRSGPLVEYFEVFQNTLRCPPRNGVMRLLSSTGALVHGLSPSAAIVDELHAFLTPSQEEVVTALQTALHKRPSSFLLAITTAGFNKQSLLGKMYEQALGIPDLELRNDGCLTIARDPENGVLFWWYAPPADMSVGEALANEEIWRLVNPASWVDIRDLRRQLNSPGLDELGFARLHLNMWTSAKDTWVLPSTWNACRDDELEIPPGARIFVMIDGAYVHDCTAVAWAWQAPDGRKVVRAHAWSPRPGVPAHVHVDGPLDNEQLVEPFVHALGDVYQVQEVVGDPRFLNTVLPHLGRRFKTAALEPVSKQMKEYVGLFYQDVETQKVAHDGDEVLAAHVAAVSGTPTPDGLWHIRKSHQSSPIDSCVAVIGANGRATRPLLEPLMAWGR